MGDGLKPIQHVRADDLAWGYDLAAREWVLRQVVETYVHDFDGEMVAVTVAGEVLEATTNHPFWVVEGEGLDGRTRSGHAPEAPPDSRTPGRWVDAGHLRIGDALLLRPDRQAVVVQLAAWHARQLVYNFQVEGVHTYAAGTSQVLVHNKPPMEGLPNGGRLTTVDGYVVPHGFETVEQYQAFVSRLRAGVGAEVEPVFQGSSVTGKSYSTGEPFDVGRVSDFDIGLADRGLFERARALGERMKTQPNRTGPIEPGSDLARQLGLDTTLQELRRLAGGRPVKFMLYDELGQALKRPSLIIPGN